MRNLTGMVATNGMKSVYDWQDLDLVGKEAWLATLAPIGVRAQASVMAAGSKLDVRQVLNAWVALGILSRERALLALAAQAQTGAGLAADEVGR